MRFLSRSTSVCPLVVACLLLWLPSPQAPAPSIFYEENLRVQAFINSPSISFLWATHLGFACKVGIFAEGRNNLLLGAVTKGFLWISTLTESSFLLTAQLGLPPHLTLGRCVEKVRVCRRWGQRSPAWSHVHVRVVGHRLPEALRPAPSHCWFITSGSLNSSHAHLGYILHELLPSGTFFIHTSLKVKFWTDAYHRKFHSGVQFGPHSSLLREFWTIISGRRLTIIQHDCSQSISSDLHKTWNLPSTNLISVTLSLFKLLIKMCNSIAPRTEPFSMAFPGELPL